MYILTIQPFTMEKRYLYHTGDFGPVREMANQLNAEDAIEKQNVFAAKGPNYRVSIEPVARNLADQLGKNRLGLLAAMLGYREPSFVFGETLKKTPPLSHGFSMRDAALAYIDALRAGVVAANPEART